MRSTKTDYVGFAVNVLVVVYQIPSGEDESSKIYLKHILHPRNPIGLCSNKPKFLRRMYIHEKRQVRHFDRTILVTQKGKK